MFYGEYPHKLNAKHQVTLPARLREALERRPDDKALFMVQVDKRCLYMYTQNGLDDVVELLKRSGSSGSKRPDSRRLFFSSVCPIDLDPHGRFVIPAHLRQAAGVGKDVIFIGNAERIEVWAADRWTELQQREQEAYRQRLQQNMAELLEW